jgi:phosphoserine phosphatase
VVITVRLSRILLAAATASLVCRLVAAQDPLPSWNEGAVKRAIVDFVSCATSDGCPDFIPPAERVAVFDNDGTLWCEQPMYVQLAFVLDRVQELAPQHPEWQTTEPYKSILAGKLEPALAGGPQAMVELVTATHAGMSTDEFEAIVSRWLATARHPRFQRPYTELVYQPMLELVAHLRANGFKTYIVSGGGVEFMRPWAELVYGIPPEHVIGSMIEERYALRDGKPAIMRLPQVDFIDDKAGKPVGIHRHIGRRPVVAVGNSDGDFEMLEWTTTKQSDAENARLGLLLHHTDAEREFAYDRQSHVGQLARGLDEAAKRGWIVVDMKSDWKAVFARPR